MSYEIHVGDYVETIDGKVGYIYYFRPNVLVFKTPDGGQYEISTDVLDWSGHPENVFKRIGAYDFTKKEKKKIENLIINKTVLQYTGDGTSNTGADYTAVYDNTKFQDKMIDKINELVDAVNTLMDKEDKE